MDVEDTPDSVPAPDPLTSGRKVPVADEVTPERIEESSPRFLLVPAAADTRLSRVAATEPVKTGAVWEPEAADTTPARVCASVPVIPVETSD